MRGRLGVLFLAAIIGGGCASQGTAASPADRVAPPSAASRSAEPTETAAFHGAVATYRGDPGRSGVMPGPGPGADPGIAWHFQALGPFGSSPAVIDGVVYAVSGEGVVHALDLAVGSERWSASLGSRASASPLIVDELVIAADEAGTVHALQLADGSATWATNTDGAITGSPALTDDRIVAATQEGSVYALDPKTGAVLWQTAVGAPVARSVAVADGTIYLGLGGELVAVSASDGSVLWRAAVAEDGTIGTPTAVGGRVFAATGLDGEDPGSRGIGMVDAATGDVGWRYASPTKAQVYTPAVAGGRAYLVGHDRLVVALDAATGEVAWSVTRNAELEALPAVVDGVVYIVGNGGPAEALDATTGASMWSVPIQGIPFAPAVVDGYLLVGTSLGTLYAIGGPR